MLTAAWGILSSPALKGAWSVLARIGMVILLVVLIWSLHQLDANNNQIIGASKWAKDHPQITVASGGKLVMNIKKMTCFPLHLGSFGFGVCHE